MQSRLLYILGALALSGFQCQGPDLCNPADVLTECGRTGLMSRLLVPASSSSCQSRSSCVIYMASASYNGSFNGVPGISGADSRCNQDANKPENSGTYKAMLVDGSARVASVTADAGDGQVDWVLYADKQYRRGDGTVVGGTSATRLLTFNLGNSISTDVGSVAWTGMANGWVTNANLCAGWVSVSVAVFGNTGTGDSNSTTAIASGNFACSTSQSIYCAQQ